MRKLSTYLGVAILIFVFVIGAAAYMVTSFNVDTQQWWDGLGRPLTESPWLMQVLLGEERLWAGWFWFIVDMIIFWGSIGVAIVFIKLGEDDKET